MCTVGARGAAPLALRYFIRDSQVVCDDAVMKRETVVGEGFSKEVGNVTVTVRTGSSAAPVAATPPRPAAPPTQVKSDPLNQVAEFDQVLPVTARPIAPVSSLSPAKLPVASKPPVPGPMTQLASKSASSAPAKPVAKNPDGCPTCGRANAGSRGSRYCVVCDQTY